MIKDGYKKTEIGVIPVEWEVEKLENLVNIVSGQSPSKFDLTGTKYKFFKVNQLNLCEKYLTNSEYAFDKEIGNLLDEGTVIFPKRGASIFTNKVRILTHKSFIDTNLMGLITNDSLNNMFLYYWLVKFRLSNIADTSSVPQINNKHINPLKIPLPPLKEQQKIANILSTADKKIEAIDLQIKKAQMLKKGLLQKLLSEGVEHSEFKDSELGRIPVGWEVVKVGNISNLTAGGTPRTSEKSYWYPQEVSWLSSGEVHKKKIFYTDNKISIKGLDNSSAKLLPCNSILIALAGQGKTRGTVAITEIELTTNQSVGAILPNDKIIPYYLYYNLDSRYDELRSLSTGSGGRGGLNLSILKSINIQLPPLKEQKQIAQILSTADEKLELLRAKKEKYETLKKGLLQKLLSGEVRVGCCP